MVASVLSLSHSESYESEIVPKRTYRIYEVFVVVGLLDERDDAAWGGGRAAMVFTVFVKIHCGLGMPAISLNSLAERERREARMGVGVRLKTDLACQKRRT